MINSIWSIIPPLLTIFLVFFTRRIIFALLAGVVSCALIINNFRPWCALKTMLWRVLAVVEIDRVGSWQGLLGAEKLFLFTFLITLGAIIALLIKSGEGFGYVYRLCQRLNSAVQAQLATLALSVMLFIDDYLNALTTSAVMRGLCDKFYVPRLKLAFLTTAMAAPLCSLAPISSWGAAIIGMLATAGLSLKAHSVVTIDGFSALLYSVPYIFFSWILIFTAFFIVIMGCSFGEINKHEQFASSSSKNLFGGHMPPLSSFNESSCETVASHSNFHFFSPLLVLSGGIFGIMLLSGGFGRTNLSFLLSLQQSMPELSLFLGAVLAFLYTALLFWLSGKTSWHAAFEALFDGFLMMKDSLIILTLAWTMANFMQHDLGSGRYLAGLLMPFLSQAFLPASTFLLSAVVAFAIGSAWATMLVVMPMVVPMVPALLNLVTPVLPVQVPLLFPVVGSVISGAIFGSSMSPIADLLVITSKNTQVNHFDYVKAQIQYLLPVGLGCTLSFGFAGIVGGRLSYWGLAGVSLLLGLLATGLIFIGLTRYAKSAD